MTRRQQTTHPLALPLQLPPQCNSPTSTPIIPIKPNTYKSDVHMSMHRKYISIVQPTRCNVRSIYLFPYSYRNK
jgi:hypothetical protein